MEAMVPVKRRVTSSFVPNLLTIANLFSGFASIIYSSNGDFDRAALFILIGAFFDMMDGAMARLINAASEFGGELDSLCDVVTFGVAPSYMLYQMHFVNLNEIGILIASLPAMMGALRLARFNVQLSKFDDKKYFKGFPIPSSALTIISYLIFFHNDPSIAKETKDIIIIAVPSLTSIAMISNIRYYNLPKPSPRNIKKYPLFFVLLALSIVSIIYTSGKTFFPLMALYLILSALIHIYKWAKLGVVEGYLQEFREEDYDDDEI